MRILYARIGDKFLSEHKRFENYFSMYFEESLKIPKIEFSTIKATEYNLVKFAKRIARRPFEAEIAISYAHKQIYQHVSNGSFDLAFILEDDAVVSEQIDIPFLISFFAERKSPTVLQLRAESIENFQLDFQSFIYELPTSASSTQAYLINQPAAHLFLEWQTPIVDLADWPSAGSKIHFFATKIRYVSTNTLQRSEVTQGKRTPRVFQKILIYTNLYYVLNKKNFWGWEDYRKILLDRRIYFYKLSARKFLKKINLKNIGKN